jgi:hypothetical protein
MSSLRREKRKFAEEAIRAIPAEATLVFWTGSMMHMELQKPDTHPGLVARILGVVCRYVRARLIATEAWIANNPTPSGRLNYMFEGWKIWEGVLWRLPDALQRLEDRLAVISGEIDPYWRDRGIFNDKRTKMLSKDQQIQSYFTTTMMEAATPTLMRLVGEYLVQLVPEDSMQHSSLSTTPLGVEFWERAPFPMKAVTTGGNKAARASVRSGGGQVPVHMKASGLDMKTALGLCMEMVHAVTHQSMTALV